MDKETLAMLVDKLPVQEPLPEPPCQTSKPKKQNLVMISIRLEQTTVQGFKTLAERYGFNYQTLMREALRHYLQRLEPNPTHLKTNPKGAQMRKLLHLNLSMLPTLKEEVVNLKIRVGDLICNALTEVLSLAEATDLPESFDVTISQLSQKLERPKIAAHGDLSCNVAMQIAKALKRNPRELAQRIVDCLNNSAAAKELIDSAEIAGPGFINLRIAAQAKQAVIAEVLNQGAAFGKSTQHSGKNVLIEFVSANPTGPLHVGHGRQAALGDALSNLLGSQGWNVHREFYYNDAGVQIANLALSVQSRAKGFKPGDAEWPESAYNGDYIADIAQDFLAKKTVSAADSDGITASGDVDDIESIRKFAVTYLRREQDIDLKTFGVKFDQYYLESSLYTDGKVDAAVQGLIAAGKTYEEGGALWLRSTDYGDDKDRVMRKSDGGYTYFVPDVAYHVTKWNRGFTKVINIQGSDHHGTIARVRAGLQALNVGIPKGYPDYVLHKMVTVMRDGQEVKISKRAGSYVTVRDLIEWSGGVHPEIEGDARNEALTRGRDAVRFFLISRKADTEFTFDVDLALKQNDENPVYYVQYAHARISSILTQWQEKTAGDLNALLNVDLSPVLAQASGSQTEALLQRLAEFPEMLSRAAEEMAPHAVAFYLRDLASDFHAFYNAERVLVDDEALKLARLALLAATSQVLQNGLSILGVSAPQRM